MQRSCSVSSLRKIKKASKKRKNSDDLTETEKGIATQDKENHDSNKQRKSKKQATHDDSHRAPLSQCSIPANRSTSAAAAMAKIASINAQAALQKAVRPQPENSVNKACKSPSTTCVPAKPTAPSPIKTAAVPVQTEPVYLLSRATESSCAIQSIQRCTSAMLDTSSSAEMRLQVSNQMALAAEKLHLEAQVEAEKASIAAKEMTLKSEKDISEHQAKDLQRTVMALAEQVKEMKETKEHHDRELQRQLKQTASVYAELQQFKSSTEALQHQVDSLQSQMKAYKAETMEVEKELQQQKQINRRLSQRLSGCFAAAGLPVDDDMDDLLINMEDCTGGAQLTTMETSLVEANLHTDPRTPKHSATSSNPFRHDVREGADGAEGKRRNSWVKVPTVTPSKAHAPAIYNEPKNKVKQREYADLLEQQIEEQRALRQQQQDIDKSMTMDYFPFGRPGSGAPVRDENSNVVANVTFTRSQRPVPMDHPAGPLHASRSQSQETFIPRRKH